MYTMPSDQSAWLYHRWLISQSEPYFNTSSRATSQISFVSPAKDPVVINREIKIIQELLEEEPDSKCLSLPDFIISALPHHLTFV